MAKVVKGTAFVSVLLTIIFVILYQQSDMDLWLTMAITFGTIAYHFCMRLLVGLVVNLRMGNRANYRGKWYQLRPLEEKLYKILQVKKWKDKMPTYSPEIFSTKEHSLAEIVQAMCQAEVVHEVIMVLSFLPILAVIPFGEFWVFFITSLLAAGFDLMFVMMQRFNRPRIIKLLNRRKK